MDKESTIEKVLESDIPDGPAIFSQKELNACMDEYAKQEAIGFGQWLEKYAGCHIGDGHWRVGHLLIRTTEELYSLYKEQVK